MPLSEIPQTEVVDRIKSDLETLVGSKMRLRANLGRCKIVEREGILEETHPNLFVVKVDEEKERPRRVSYSYADVLTRTVELTHPQSGENLLPWLH
ncbi:MAG: Veg family protein [Actinomycetota bacterium]|nr:Veg family protein [Actinomycetota bacterium]